MECVKLLSFKPYELDKNYQAVKWLKIVPHPYLNALKLGVGGVSGPCDFNVTLSPLTRIRTLELGLTIKVLGQDKVYL